MGDRLLDALNSLKAGRWNLFSVHNKNVFVVVGPFKNKNTEKESMARFKTSLTELIRELNE